MKKIIKKIIGENRIIFIKLFIKKVKNNLFNRKKMKLYINNKFIQNEYLFSENGYNIFNGYYDLNPIKNKKMLVHKLKIKSGLQDSIELGYYDINNNTYQKIDDSNAWCWQQGSRLRWSEVFDNCVYYNSVYNNSYVCNLYNIEEKNIIKTINLPLYDISIDETYGVSLDFERLQFFRPGYGYCYLNKNKFENAPKDDGLIYIDLKTGAKKMLISLYELAIKVDSNLKYPHYLNHISISPDGSKIMFFHIWNVDKSKWKTELCVINCDGSNFKSLELNNRVSHYDWKNNDSLLITSVLKDSEECEYRYYYLNNKTKKIQNNSLKRDGHPTFIGNSENFITDTYPDEYGNQSVLLYLSNDNNVIKLADLPSDVMLYDQKRCDLHPKLSHFDGNNYISIDTTFKNRRRSVMVLEMRDENNE